LSIDWERGSLQIGPKYNLSRAPRMESYLLRRKSQLDAEFGGLVWQRDNNSLRIFKPMKALRCEQSTRWEDVYAAIAELFGKFKRHFEPRQRRY
jgi:hypothetical protein